MAIYVTGDIHGADSINKLSHRHWADGRNLTRDDYVIILGDFGLVWSDPPSGEDCWWLDWLEERPWTTLFIDGNHENHDLLDAMPQTSWHGGAVHFVRPHVLHLMRGYVFELPTGNTTARVLTFGGASSHDVRYRTEGISWWSRELPSVDEYARAKASLATHHQRVDFILTHDCPSTTKRALLGPMASGAHHGWDADRWADDRLNAWLDEIDAATSYDTWYFGHYHCDCQVDSKHVAVYRDIIELDC